MITFGYCIIWFVWTVAAFLLGFASHYSHAFHAPYPDKLFDGDRWINIMSGETMSPHQRWYGQYDNDGEWEFYSLRNLSIHVTPPTVMAIGAGLVYWTDRAYVVKKFCAGVGELGLVPLFCG